MHSAPVSAEIAGCQQLAMECAQGNQQACTLYKWGGCEGKAPSGSTLVGAPPSKSNHE
jgi:hypothetical protein